MVTMPMVTRCCEQFIVITDTHINNVGLFVAYEQSCNSKELCNDLASILHRWPSGNNKLLYRQVNATRYNNPSKDVFEDVL